MARGFLNILGSGSTDLIVTSLTTDSTLRSYHIWTNRHGDGGNSLGRIFDRNNGTQLDVLLNTAGPGYRFQVNWSGASGVWDITPPSVDVWAGIGVSYDRGSTANDPVIYLNGSSVSVTEVAAPSGTVATGSSAYTIGNRQSDSARAWDGMLAEFGVWDALLDAAEFKALGSGVSPLLIRPASLVCYIPMLRDSVDLKRGGTPTITGTAVQPHPRSYYPAGTYSDKWTTAVGGGGFRAAWARRANTVIYPGVRAA